MQCINCGQSLPEDNQYCPKCGKYQPLAKTNDKKTTHPVFANLSIIFLLIGIIPIPLMLIGVATFIFIGTVSSVSVIEILIPIIKFIFITSGFPLLLALFFKLISK